MKNFDLTLKGNYEIIIKQLTEEISDFNNATNTYHNLGAFSTIEIKSVLNGRVFYQATIEGVIAVCERYDLNFYIFCDSNLIVIHN